MFLLRNTSTLRSIRGEARPRAKTPPTDAFGKCEYWLKGAKATQRKLANRHHPRRAMPGEFTRGEYRIPGFTGQLFKPRRQVDGRADTGEIESVAAADIAVQHLADMQREAKARATADPDPDKGVGCGNLRLDFVGCLQRLSARVREVGRLAGDRKDRQHPVAHEFQDFASAVENRRDLAIEIAI